MAANDGVVAGKEVAPLPERPIRPQEVRNVLGAPSRGPQGSPILSFSSSDQRRRRPVSTISAVRE